MKRRTLNGLLSLLFALCIAAASSATAATLHLVVIADNGTGDDGFDKGISRDLVNILVLGQNAASDAGLTFSATALYPGPITSNSYRYVTRNGKKVRTGGHWSVRNLTLPFDGLTYSRKNNVKRAEIRTAIKGLKVGADDVVWVHYTGHGFRWDDKQNKWPALYLDPQLNNSIEFEEILTLLRRSPARLKLAFADSCNSLVGEEMPDSQKHSGARGASTRKRGFKKLFKEGEGYLFMGGAKPGEFGWSVDPQGGVFTYKIVHRIMIEVEKGSSASWDSMAVKFKKPIRDFGIKQTPVYEFAFGAGKGGVDANAPAYNPNRKKAPNLGKFSPADLTRFDRSKLSKNFKRRPTNAVSKNRKNSKQLKTPKKRTLSKKAQGGKKRSKARKKKRRRPQTKAQCRKACAKRFKKSKSKRRRCARSCDTRKR